MGSYDQNRQVQNASKSKNKILRPPAGYTATSESTVKPAKPIP
jgi:hypothetical protein